MNKKILIAGIATIFFLLLVPSVGATWCNNDYGKKAPILINNTGGSEQTHYQVELNITHDSNMNANFSVPIVVFGKEKVKAKPKPKGG